jgi:hypothetical protein
MNTIKCPGIRIGFGVALLAALTGCAGHVARRGSGEAYAVPPTVEVEAAVSAQDNYVYYPDYQVYYSSNRRQYMYLDRGAWVTRSAPPHVAVNVLLDSPSVKLGFHDSPANHHADVVRQYPKHPPQPARIPDQHLENLDNQGRINH